jgi:hypothetical protein
VRRGRIALGATLLLALGCRGTLSPLSNKLKVGEESYLVMVADGEEGKGDLFAAAPVSGTTYQVTFTRLDERAPALSQDGALLAFLRSLSPGDSAGASLVILNLLNGAERRLAAPPGIEALRWAPNGAFLYARGPAGLFRTPAPPAPLALSAVPEAERGTGDSLFRILLGAPPMGEARPCATGAGICASLETGDSLVLSAGASEALAWGGDSVAYLEEDGLVVRPLGGGRTRVIRWEKLRHPRELTRFAGVRVARDTALR